MIVREMLLNKIKTYLRIVMCLWEVSNGGGVL